MNKNNDKNYDMIEKICIAIIVCLSMSFCIFCFLGMVFASRVVLVIAFVFTIFVGIILNKSDKFKSFLNAIFHFIIHMIVLVIVGFILIYPFFVSLFRGCY